MSEAAPSAHLLRTLAAVSPAARVLDLGCGRGRHAEPLARLGFDLWACDPDADAVAATRVRLAPILGPEEAARRVSCAPFDGLGYPNDHFDWAVAYGAFDRPADAQGLFDALAEARRVLRPGAWIVAALRPALAGENLTPEALSRLFEEAGFALAEVPAVEDGPPTPFVRGIFRKVDRHTVG